MHEEYKLYDRKKLSSRLSKLRSLFHESMNRQAIDEEAFEIFRNNHQVSLFSHKGYPEWQGSEAQKYALIDIEQGIHKTMSKLQWWESRNEYFENFPLGVFRDKIKQEIRTAKYLYTCRVRGKLHVAS